MVGLNQICFTLSADEGQFHGTWVIVRWAACYSATCRGWALGAAEPTEPVGEIPFQHLRPVMMAKLICADETDSDQPNSLIVVRDPECILLPAYAQSGN